MKTWLHKQAWILFGLAVLGFLLRIWRLDFRAISLDEAYSLNLASSGLAGIWHGASADVHPPFFHFLLSAWIHGVGTNVIWARALTCLFSALLIPLVFKLAEDAFQARPAAWYAAGIVAVSPYFVELGRWARMPAFLALLAGISCWAYWRLITRQRFWLYAGVYALSTLLAMYTQYYAFLMIAAQNVFLAGMLLFRPGSWPRRRVMIWLGLQVALAAAYIPWLPSFWTQMASQRLAWKGAGLHSWDYHLFLQLLIGTCNWSKLSKVTSVFALLGALVWLAAGLYTARREIRRNYFQPAVLWLLTLIAVPVTLVTVYSFLRNNIFDNRYFGFTALALIVLLSGLLQALPVKKAGLALAWLLLAFALPLYNCWYVYGGFSDFRAVAETLRARQRPGDWVLVYPDYYQLPLQYYLQHAVPVLGLPQLPLSPAGEVLPQALPQARLQQLTDESERIWYLHTEPVRPAEHALQVWLGSTRALEKEYLIRDVCLKLFVKETALPASSEAKKSH